MNSNDTKIITMGTRSDWGPLNPPQQSTYVAEIILGNIFETLVDYDLNGNLRPKLAKSWTVSDDLKTYEFIIDTSVKFSNGQSLNSSIIKKSFEQSLAAMPASTNASSLDVFYKLVDFESFPKTQNLSGILTPSEDKLILKFTTSFRQALSYLSGVRYAAFLFYEGNYYGTGPYKLVYANDQEVSLEANSFAIQAPAFAKAHIYAMPQPQFLWGDEICKKQFDVIVALSPDLFSACVLDKYKLKMESGAFNTHYVIQVNGMKERMFSDPHLRRAIQYLILKNSKPILEKNYDLTRVVMDPQFFLPLQVGRIPDEEAQELIGEGRKWVKELINASNKHPIQFWIRDKKDQQIADALRKEGLLLKTNEGFITFSKYKELYYKTFDFDLLAGGAGVGGLDPDDLYHYLGQHGAITSPTIGREEVWDLLEVGRKVVKTDSLHFIYKNLSRSILTDVPSVHLAHNRIGYFYNAHKVQMVEKTMNYYRFNLAQFSRVN